VFTSNLISQTTWLKVKLVNFLLAIPIGEEGFGMGVKSISS